MPGCPASGSASPWVLRSAPAGALLQTMLRNPLADPGLLGLPAGAALAVVALFTFAPAEPSLATVALVALAGAAATALAALVLAGGLHRAGSEPLRLILGAPCWACCSRPPRASRCGSRPPRSRPRRPWLAGSLADRPDGLLVRLGLPLAACGAALVLMAPALAPLVAGEAQARSVGAEPGPVRAAALLAALGLASLAVALAGPIGFAGLIAPHLARPLPGPLPLPLFLASAAIGAALLVGADAVARGVVAPA